MYVTVWSHWEGKQWAGEVPDPPAGQDVLSYIWRFFNRVDDGDHERLMALDYTLPSLSVNDVVEVDGVRATVLLMGWDVVPT
jgi:hypothetical protein